MPVRFTVEMSKVFSSAERMFFLFSDSVIFLHWYLLQVSALLW